MYEKLDIKKDIDNFWKKFEHLTKEKILLAPFYNRQFYEFQKEYCKSKSTLIDEKSIIISDNKEPVCAFIFLINNDGETYECNFGSDYPGLIIFKERINQKILNLFLEELKMIKSNFKNIRFTIPEDKIHKEYEEIIKNNHFRHNMIWSRSIYTNQSRDILWKNIRKSYKSPINKGLREQEFFLLDFNNPDIRLFRKIQALHFEVSGRKTRSQRTWDLQYEAIKKDKAFAFCAYQKDILISAVYFIKTKKHAYYSVGIYTNESKRRLYGYSLIWKSIIYCQDRKINFLELDYNVNFKFIPDNEEKLIKISHFKSGFGGAIYPRHEFII